MKSKSRRQHRANGTLRLPAATSRGHAAGRVNPHPNGASTPGRGLGSYVLITGGAGFIGTNVADRILQSGRRVLIYDNLSRPGVENNLQWLLSQHGSQVLVEVADVCDRQRLKLAVRNAEQVFHFAAQVAVTSSLKDPIHDFEVNARGTLNLLTELRALDNPPPLLFTSTNKVYGAMPDVALQRNDTRYEPSDTRHQRLGIDESRALDFHSPYGCSKGFADQAVRDHARSYGLRTVVFRMSCIYGRHQMGNEDQGWVAHFLIQALEGRPITLYGDGRQVRDLLCVDDLVDAMLLAQSNIDRCTGQAFNMGGGPRNAKSLVELIQLIEQIHGEPVRVRFGEWRAGDQRYYTTDTRRFSKLCGWSPRIDVEDGVRRVYQWLADRMESARSTHGIRAAVK